MILCVKNTSRYCVLHYRRVIKKFVNINLHQFHTYKSKMDQQLVLYADEVSPPARFVMMTASLLNIEVNIQKIDLFKGENKSETYAKINPLQKVPALMVDNKVILDSHAAAIYLCQRSSSQDLYPSDVFLRAKVNEMLFFNSSTLFRLDSEIISNYFSGNWPVSESKTEEWNSALDYIESLLNQNIWLTGDKMTLCDICIMQTITSMVLCLPLTDRHKNIGNWINKFEDLPCININKRGLERLKHYIDLYKSEKYENPNNVHRNKTGMKEFSVRL